MSHCDGWPQMYSGLEPNFEPKKLQPRWSRLTCSCCLHFYTARISADANSISDRRVQDAVDLCNLCNHSRKVIRLCVRRRNARQAGTAGCKICICHTLWQPGIPTGRLNSRVLSRSTSRARGSYRRLQICELMQRESYLCIVMYTKMLPVSE